MMSTTTLLDVPSCRHPFADTLLQVCLFLPNPFTVQDVVRAVAIHCPEREGEMPGAWECLRAQDDVRTVGLCGSVFEALERCNR